MRIFITCFILFFTFLAAGQVEKDKLHDTVIYYKEKQQYYFLKLQNANQTIYFDSSIYNGNEPICLFVQNNTQHTIYIDFPRSSNNSISWKLKSPSIILPNEYYVVEAHPNDRYNKMHVANTTMEFNYKLKEEDLYNQRFIVKLSGYLQKLKLPKIDPVFPDTVKYNPEQRHYTFLFSKKNQAFFWDTITGKEKCYFHIVNDTKDTIIIERVGSTSDPLYWFLESNKVSNLYLPNDTIHLQSKLSRRLGPFTRSVDIKYHTNILLSSQFYYIKTWGYFKDAVELKRIQMQKRVDSTLNAKIQYPLIKYYKDSTILSKEYEDGRHYKYYPNGQLKYQRDPVNGHDTVPIIVEYYENGIIKEERFNRKGQDDIKEIRYYPSGKTEYTLAGNNFRTDYYESGKVKRKMRDTQLDDNIPEIEAFSEDGCLLWQRFINGKELFYSETVCNQLIKEEIKEKNKQVVITFENGRKISKTVTSTSGAKTVQKGKFSKDTLMEGTIQFFTSIDNLFLEVKINKGQRDSILSPGEEQGKQINLYASNLKKTGLWIYDKVSKQPFAVDDHFEQTISDVGQFGPYHYIFSDGDTISRITLHRNGSDECIYKYSKDAYMGEKAPYIACFYPNKLKKSEVFRLKNGFDVVINYSEKEANKIVDGRKGNNGKLIFKNNRLIEIRSYPLQEEKLDALPLSDTGAAKNNEGKNYCIEKGKFNHFELYNGFISYYTLKDELLYTEKVVNGFIEHNPRVTLVDEQLLQVMKNYDLNYNGWVEKRELDELEYLRLILPSGKIESFHWNELKLFKNLSGIEVNNLIYRISDYKSIQELKLAVLNNKGKQRVYQQPYEPAPPAPAPFEVLVVDFPDMEAKFPGGEKTMNEWIYNELKYPSDIANQEKVQGVVYVQFVVMKDGSISDILIRKELHPSCAKEAIRIIQQMPKWEPAIKDGKKVNSRMIVPIKFKKP